MKIQYADDIQCTDVDMDGAQGVRMQLLIHDADGAPNFFMRQFTVAPGGNTPLHTHDWEHEVYILSGKGVAVASGKENQVRAGDCVFVDPNIEHQFVNRGNVELKFLCLVPRK